MSGHWSEMLAQRGACSEALTWAAARPDAATAWAKCERADWMLWIAVRLNREACRPALYAIADQAVRFYAPRSMAAIAERREGETARLLREWAETLRALPEIVDEETAWYGNGWARAAYAADAAAYAADAADDAAAYAADAAAAAYAAAYAAYAADAAAAAYAAAADADADAADARRAALREMADLVRAKLPFSALSVAEAA